MRPTQLARFCVALGLGFGPALISSGEPVVENQPDPDSEIAPYVTDAKTDTATRVPEIVKLLRDKVKYIFVIFQENRSFDEEYGTFPGAHGLFSQSEKKTPGFTQFIMNTDGTLSTIQPFRLDQEWLPWDLDDVSHAHDAMVEKMNIVNGKPTMDKFALVEESLHYNAQFPTLAAKQYGELETAYIASLPLSFTGSQMQSLTQYDVNPSADLADIRKDISFLATTQQSVNWGWYQEGFSSADVGGIGAYIEHHNGPQYFGYVAGNTQINKHLHPVSQFFTDVSNQNLGSSGVYYIRGGFQNQLGLTPDNPDTTVQADFQGDDDHPGYSDSQLSEALVATEINAIANSPYWDQCAIIIAYDESEGDYDHVPPDIIAYDPNTLPLSRGPRIPLTVISPFAATHVVSHELGDHNSVIKFINLIFGLEALQDLPDEAAAQKLGIDLFQQPNLGPEDDPKTDVGDLISAFSVSRLKGHNLLPASYVLIDQSAITKLPHWGTDPLKTHLHITPTDSKRNNVVPDDFDPRPSSQPGFTPAPGAKTPQGS
jgi:hypothetical protein